MSHEEAIPDCFRSAAGVAREAAMTEESFRALYERHARSLWAFLYRMTSDRALAEDLLQETFYRFLRAGAAAEDELHARNSLFRIAANLARDAHRRRLIRLPFVRQDAGTESVPDAGWSPGDLRLDLQRAFGALKPRERLLLWLAYAEGATHKEIAAAAGVRESSVKSLLSRARGRLAALLRGQSSKEGA
ncbi:MAG: RNA polymerase sigma factor [Bryobacteraceae bacterium]